MHLFKGLLFSTVIGLLALWLSPFIPLVNGVLLALVLGILISNLWAPPDDWAAGIQFSSKNVLEWAIIFMGFGISFTDISELGTATIFIIGGTIVLVLLSTYVLAKKLKCPESTGLLIGFGTAICGSSAIAALAPKVAKSKNEIGIAIAVINILGALAMLAFPFVAPYFTHPQELATLIGASLHGVSHVAGAGYGISEEVGNLAITVKLGRVALLAPALIFFNVLLQTGSNFKEHLKLPYYVVGFLVASTLVTFIDLPHSIIDFTATMGKLFLTISMAGIGLNIKLAKIGQQGKKALLFGVIIFMVQLLVSGSLIAFLG